MNILTLTPSPPLADVVERFWIYEGLVPPHDFERVLPAGREEILINLMDGELRCYEEDKRPNGRTPGPIVTGLHRSAYVIDTRQQAAIMGVHLKPGGAWRLLGVPAHELSNARVDLRAILGREIPELMDRLMAVTGAGARLQLLDRLLCARPLRSLHPAVEWASLQIARYSESIRVAGLAEKSGISSRWFGEIFNREIGMSPKSYARLRRFRRTLDSVHGTSSPDWCDLAATMGYADQAHLIREFREFSGLTPTAYHARRGICPHLVALPGPAAKVPVPLRAAG
jgi:AraC-like DNA-binding protein